MPRQFMVGTLDDTPLLQVTVDGTLYFLELDTKVVFEDKPGLPKVTDEELIARVLDAANKIE